MRTAALVLSLVTCGVLCASASAFTFFSSPSRNIGCYIDPASGVRCDIRQRDWSPPPKPANCDVDYGQGIGLGPRNVAGFVCAGDTALGPKRILAYGHSASGGRYTCKSTKSAMVCRNRRSGHGFSLSRQRYRLF
jgi:hypothetical protein